MSERARALASDTRLQRLVIWGMCSVSLCITLALIRSIKVSTGLDPFSVLVYGFLPVGAMLVAGMACAGYMLGARHFQWRADGWDLLFLMATCLLLQILLVAIDYWSALAGSPELAGHLSYAKFFAETLTTAEYIGKSHNYAQYHPLGEPGLLLMLPRIGGLLALAKVIHGSVGRPKSNSY
jgi:hypothetical protein